MEGRDGIIEEIEDEVLSRPFWTYAMRGFLWLSAIAVGLALLIAAALTVLDTDRGRVWLIARVMGLTPESGLRIGIDRIDGSLYGAAVVHGLTLSDPQGRFLEAPRVELDWRPQAVFSRRLHIVKLVVPEARLLKVPKLIPSAEEKPILPNYDIYVGRFQIGNLTLEPPVLGKRHQISADGGADIASGRLLAALRANSRTGGDALVARIDARPDDKVFDIEGRLLAPAGGVVGGILGLDQPLVANIEGEGSWQKWRGTAVGTLGDAPLMNLALSADDGRFALKGSASPGLAIGGIVRKFGSPSIEVDAAATIAERVIEGRASIVSPSVGLELDGTIDLAESRFRTLSVGASVRQPKALISTMTADDMRLAMTLDGPFSRPLVDYRLSANWLAIGTTRLDRVEVTGKGELPKDKLAVPVEARALRVTGLGELVEALATNPRITGVIALEGPYITAKGLKLSSDRVTATADLNIETRTGRYSVNADGSVPRYAIPGLGMADIKAKLLFEPDARAGNRLRISGKADAAMKRLDNGLLTFLFQGNPRVVADIVRTPDGLVTFTNAVLTSPDMRVTGRGTYAMDQRIRFNGNAVSKRYGPMDVELGGLVTRPEARILVKSYAAGIELRDIRATFTPQGENYAFTALADTVAGPARARGRILTGAPQTVYDIEAAEIAGLTASGPLRAVDGAPAVSGVLDVRGTGISGKIRLSPEGGVQRIDANLGARAARLDFGGGTTIRRGWVDGNIVLREAGAEISGRFDIEGLKQSALLLKTLKGTLEMQAGEGTAALIATGERGAPFTFDLAASFDPESIIVTSQGTIARQKFALAAPARLDRTDEGWHLAPVVLNLPSGTARISGTFGDSISLTTDLNAAGLGLLQLALPGMDFTGTASGRIDMIFPSGALPRGTAKLRVTDFTRATEAFSKPVDLAVVAQLEANKAVMRAAFLDNGKRLGILQGRLLSIPGSIDDPWLDRLMKAPITGQLRWRGPAEMLWPLTGVGALSVRGNIAVALEISGELGDPSLTGIVRSRASRIESAITGTVVDNIRLDGRFTGSRLELTEFSGTAGSGSISGSGGIDLSFARGFPIEIAMVMKSALILNRDDLRATASGPLRISNSPEGAIISGNVNIDKARFNIGQTAQTEVPLLRVREKNTELLRAEPLVVEGAPEPTVWQLDVKAKGNNEIMVRGMGLDSEWSADLDIKGSATAPRIGGVAELVRGDYEFAGKTFRLTRGELRFTGTYPPDPVVDIAAEARVEGLTATITIRGTGQRPEIAFSSVPALPQDEVLSRVLFGTSIANLSAPEALQLAGAVASLQGGGGGINPINAVRRAVGLDRLRIMEANQLTGQKTAVAAGEYLTDRVYVEVATDAQGYTATQLEIELTRALSILSSVATLGGTSVNLRWSKDY